MTRRHASFICLATLSVCGAGCDSTPATSMRPQAAAPVKAQPDGASRVQFADSFRSGSEQALHEGKPLLLFFTASWCEHCQRMAAETFGARQVAELSERFVCVQIDADQEPGLCQKFGVSEFPTVQFVSSRGAVLHRVVGRRSPTGLMNEMQAAWEAVAFDVPTSDGV